jgi:endonuclease YncB( thermonuclease family)
LPIGVLNEYAIYIIGHNKIEPKPFDIIKIIQFTMMKQFCCFKRHRCDIPAGGGKALMEVCAGAAPVWDDTVPFVVPISCGSVIKVYDGDTITIAAKLPYAESQLYRFSVRLNGVDTPEIKGKNDDEISVAKEARDALSALILHKNIVLKNVATEKYGRVLADVYLDELHINKWLIDHRFAVKYDGGTKKAPESWVQYRLVG